jgi:hypothetical protein
MEKQPVQDEAKLNLKEDLIQLKQMSGSTESYLAGLWHLFKVRTSLFYFILVIAYCQFLLMFQNKKEKVKQILR